MNVKLLQKVAKHILAEPKRFYMGTWGIKTNPNESDAPACGTICCIAGWATVLSKNPKTENHFNTLMAHADDPSTNGLRLDIEQSERLFYVSGWPIKFRRAYTRLNNKKALANLAARRIAHFIETEGRE